MNQEEIDLFKISDKVFGSAEELCGPERVFLCVWELEAEVNNGGFHQYYFNTAGDRATEAATALTALGADSMANFVREANKLFGSAGPSPDRDTRQQQLLALPPFANDRMNELDAEFYKYPDKLDQLLKNYVGKHRETFFAR